MRLIGRIKFEKLDIQDYANVGHFIDDVKLMASKSDLQIIEDSENRKLLVVRK
jgi:hypothetical protein